MENKHSQYHSQILINAIIKHRRNTRLYDPFSETPHDRELWAMLPHDYQVKEEGKEDVAKDTTEED